MKITQIGQDQTQLEFSNGNTMLFSFNIPVAARVWRPSGHKIFVVNNVNSLETKQHITAWLVGKRDEQAECSPEFLTSMVPSKLLKVSAC